MNSIPTFVDTRTIIVNLLKEDKTTYLSLERLQDLLDYIYLELWKLEKLKDYQITFDVNFDALERTVMYNREVFALDIRGETIYLRDTQEIDALTWDYTLDDTLLKIIREFADAA